MVLITVTAAVTILISFIMIKAIVDTITRPVRLAYDIQDHKIDSISKDPFQLIFSAESAHGALFMLGLDFRVWLLLLLLEIKL